MRLLKLYCAGKLKEKSLSGTSRLLPSFIEAWLKAQSAYTSVRAKMRR